MSELDRTVLRMKTSHVLLVGLAWLSSGCNGDTPVTPTTILRITITGSTTVLTAVGATVQLAVTVARSDGIDFGVAAPAANWTSSDITIASVSSNGLVTAVDG